MRSLVLTLLPLFLLAACQQATPAPSASFAENDRAYPSFTKAPFSTEFTTLNASKAPVMPLVEIAGYTPLPLSCELSDAPVPPVVETAVVTDKTDETEEYAAFSESSALDSSELGEIRGAFAASSDGILGLLDAINAHNQNTNSVNGGNIVSSSALTNNSGLVSIVQNSGNNVIIQNATLVNLQFK